MTVDTQEIQYTKTPRAELIAALRKRDGDRCQHPDCNGALNFSVLDGPQEVTLDHWMPQYFGKAEGWTYEQIWDLSNLKLMHKKCNAKKGDLIPNEDGTLPKKPSSTFKFRRQKRAGRAEACAECDNGHNLTIGEVCANCGCNAQRLPRSAKVRFDECDHELFWCWVCSITPDMRPASIGTAMRQADSDELGEWSASDERT